MSKVKLLTWTDASKTVKISLPMKEIELKQTRSLFARLLIIARTREELDLQDLIGHYEFSCVPRSLFASDGSLLPCTDKSKLMALLESLGTDETEHSDENMEQDQQTGDPQIENSDNPSQMTSDKRDTVDPQSTRLGTSEKAIILDGMAVVHELSGQQIRTCLEIAQAFIKAIDSKSQNYTLVHIVFDRYDIAKSLKTRTRNHRQGKQGACCKYDVSDKTQFNIPLNHFLSNSDNKDQLATYLAKKLLHFYRDSTKSVIVATKDGAASNGAAVDHLHSNHEEADTLLILHAISASRLMSNVHIMTPDTDVFVLALQKLHLMSNKVSMLVGTGSTRRLVKLQPIHQALDENLAAGIVGFHAFTGSDTTGRIAGKGKQTCWKLFKKANKDILKAFAQLGQTLFPSTEVIQGLEEFVCSLFEPRMNIKDLGHLRWHLFKRNKAEAEKLPPTKAALKEHILRAHYQAMIWLLADTANPNLPSPTNYGWDEEDSQYVPRVSDLPPAPTAVVELVKCGCGKSRC